MPTQQPLLKKTRPSLRRTLLCSRSSSCPTTLATTTSTSSRWRSGSCTTNASLTALSASGSTWRRGVCLFVHVCACVCVCVRVCVCVFWGGGEGGAGGWVCLGGGTSAPARCLCVSRCPVLLPCLLSMLLATHVVGGRASDAASCTRWCRGPHLLLSTRPKPLTLRPAVHPAPAPAAAYKRASRRRARRVTTRSWAWWPLARRSWTTGWAWRRTRRGTASRSTRTLWATLTARGSWVSRAPAAASRREGHVALGAGRQATHICPHLQQHAQRRCCPLLTSPSTPHPPLGLLQPMWRRRRWSRRGRCPSPMRCATRGL
jgi:hypothetical protein